MTTAAIAGNSWEAEPFRREQPETDEHEPHTDGSTLVMSIGFPARAFCADQGAIASLPLTSIEDDFLHLADTVGAGVRAEQTLIAVYPSFDARIARRAATRLHTLRLGLGTQRLVPLACDLPPLAAGVFVSILSAASRYLPSPGILMGCVPFFKRQVFAYAWFASLHGVVRPKIRPAIRLRSVLGRGPFAAALWPAPALWALSRNHPIERPHIGPITLAVAPHDGDPTWTTTDLVDAVRPENVVWSDPPPLGPEWWGTRNLVEAVAYPTDIPTIVSRATSAAVARPCRWCGAEVVTEVCPLCAMADAAATTDPSAPARNAGRSKL